MARTRCSRAARAGPAGGKAFATSIICETRVSAESQDFGDTGHVMFVSTDHQEVLHMAMTL